MTTGRRLMIRGMYSAASALVVASEEQEVTAYNLAHANQTGYRARGLVVESFDRVLGRTTEPTGDIVGARTVEAYHDFRPGALEQTGHPYDLALAEADRFFVLEGPNGPLYTRNGTFYRTADGQLVSQAGFPLRGEDGPLTFPPNTVQLTIASDGSVTADGQPLGNLNIVRFTNLRELTAVGPTLYTASPQAGPVAEPGRVLQGYREGSNIQPADAMVKLIIAARSYDAGQRALRTLSESVQLNTRPQAN